MTDTESRGRRGEKALYKNASFRALPDADKRRRRILATDIVAGAPTAKRVTLRHKMRPHQREQLAGGLHVIVRKVMNVALFHPHIMHGITCYAR